MSIVDKQTGLPLATQASEQVDLLGLAQASQCARQATIVEVPTGPLALRCHNGLTGAQDRTGQTSCLLLLRTIAGSNCFSTGASGD
mmetsp:Transcript_6172/g.12548  ORF Transcript_6172/g.12548 Transcript_6172/m.12548 type:complete len:86 (-) Transcript_6172:1492-1749(-)